MKIRNSTSWPVWFLRRMTSWCAKQIGMPSRHLKLAVFRNSRSAWGGAARQWRKQITVCVGHAGHFPANCSTHAEGERFSDREECLVAVTAHELYHIAAGIVGGPQYQGTRGTAGHSSERVTCKEEMRVLTLFRQMRNDLMASWSEPSACARRSPEKTPMERRREKAVQDLKRWERKLALAKTKVRKLTAKVRRYQIDVK